MRLAIFVTDTIWFVLLQIPSKCSFCFVLSLSVRLIVACAMLSKLLSFCASSLSYLKYMYSFMVYLSRRSSTGDQGKSTSLSLISWSDLCSHKGRLLREQNLQNPQNVLPLSGHDILFQMAKRNFVTHPTSSLMLLNNGCINLVHQDQTPMHNPDKEDE